MKLFTNILIVTGNPLKETVLDQVLALTDKSGAEIKLMEVLEPHLDKENSPLDFQYAEYLADSVRRRLKHNCSEQLRMHGWPDMRVRTKTLIGTPHREILREIDRDHHDLVVVGFDQRNVFLNSNLMNIAMHLLRTCPTPVLISRSSENTNFKNVMAAVNPSQISGPFEAPANALNEKIISLANAVALNMNHNVHILNCWRHPMETRLKQSAGRPRSETHKILKEARERQKEKLAVFLHRSVSEHIKYRVHLLQGQAEQLIPSVAHKNQVNLVVLGTVGRSGMDGLMFGNTAEKILCHSNLSLLALKPDRYLPVSVNSLTPAEAACLI